MSSPNDTSGTAKPTPSKSIWDNDLPAGDSPFLPRWPLTASIIAYVAWMVFLVGMMIVRLTYTG